MSQRDDLINAEHVTYIFKSLSMHELKARNSAAMSYVERLIVAQEDWFCCSLLYRMGYIHKRVFVLRGRRVLSSNNALLFFFIPL